MTNIGRLSFSVGLITTPKTQLLRFLLTSTVWEYHELKLLIVKLVLNERTVRFLLCNILSNTITAIFTIYINRQEGTKLQFLRMRDDKTFFPCSSTLQTSFQILQSVPSLS